MDGDGGRQRSVSDPGGRIEPLERGFEAIEATSSAVIHFSAACSVACTPLWRTGIMSSMMFHIVKYFPVVSWRYTQLSQLAPACKDDDAAAGLGDHEVGGFLYFL